MSHFKASRHNNSINNPVHKYGDDDDSSTPVWTSKDGSISIYSLLG